MKKIIACLLVGFAANAFADTVIKVESKEAPKSISKIVTTIDADNSIVHGSLSRIDIAKVISSYIGEVENCYTKEGETHGLLNGDVMAEFTIDSRGKVMTLGTFQGSMPYAKTKTCMTDVFQKMPFPKAKNRTTAVFPIKFIGGNYLDGTAKPVDTAVVAATTETTQADVVKQTTTATTPKTQVLTIQATPERAAPIAEKVPAPMPVLGRISKDDIASTIASKMGDIEHCYEVQLVEKPQLAGEILESFTIETNGDVSTVATLLTSLNDAPTETCVNDIFKSLKFSRPIGENLVKVSYPLKFKLNQDKLEAKK